MGTSEFFHSRIVAEVAVVSLSSFETISRVYLSRSNGLLSSTLVAATHDLRWGERHVLQLFVEGEGKLGERETLSRVSSHIHEKVVVGDWNEGKGGHCPSTRPFSWIMVCNAMVNRRSQPSGTQNLNFTL